MADERRPRGLLDTSVVIDLEQLGRDLSDATQQRDVKLKYRVGASDRVPEPAVGDTRSVDPGREKMGDRFGQRHL